jgi:hypothetical protein
MQESARFAEQEQTGPRLLVMSSAIGGIPHPRIKFLHRRLHVKNLSLSGLLVSTMFLIACSGSSSVLGAATTRGAAGLGQQSPTRTPSPAAERTYGHYVWVWQKFVIPPYIRVDVHADCPPDHVVIGGGQEVESGDLVLRATKPNSAFDRWIVSGPADHSNNIRLTVYAVCASIK